MLLLASALLGWQFQLRGTGLGAGFTDSCLTKANSCEIVFHLTITLKEYEVSRVIRDLFVKEEG